MADATAFQSSASGDRKLVTAELLAVGTELTVGETTDTNSGELARSLVAQGVTVLRVSNLPDDLAVVVDALGTALARADLVVTTGGLGPTPDDLTREAVAEACGETPVEDEATLAWLRELWARRRQPFPEVNRKQAWTIPSATILPNPNGTAPGWLVARPDGRVIVTLPGPPREMRPMWTDEVLPRLAARGVGVETEVRTLRLTGIGESQVAERLGEPLLRATNPIVATYARQEAVDIRISARTDASGAASDARRRGRGGRPGGARRVRLGARRHVMGGRDRARRSAGAAGRSRPSSPGRAARSSGCSAARAACDARRSSSTPAGRRRTRRPTWPRPMRAGPAAGADVGIAVRAVAAGNDTAVNVAVVTPDGRHAERRLAFMRGGLGAERAAIASAAVLLGVLRADDRSPD